ncbi:hypothetical protein V8C86DRAFT_2431428 [Haematococcus lacustris]
MKRCTGSGPGLTATWGLSQLKPCARFGETLHKVTYLQLKAEVPQELCLAMAGGVTKTVPGLDLTFEREQRTMRVALSKLQPEQVWTWQALAAGTPVEATLQILLPALPSLY